MKSAFLLLITVITFICSCTEQTSSTIQDTGSITIRMQHFVGADRLQFEKGNYVNNSSESYSVDVLRYYVSNISLVKSDGSIYSIPQDSSYFLISFPENTSCNLHSIPRGSYTGIRFTLGVDSARCVAPIAQRKGCLDPGQGMYWTWNQGFIFFKMEGLSNVVPEDAGGEKRYRMHIGGFGGYSAKTFNNIRNVTLPLPTPLILEANTTKNISLKVNIAKVFNGLHTISLQNESAIMFTNSSVNVADNYSTMFETAEHD